MKSRRRDGSLRIAQLALASSTATAASLVVLLVSHASTSSAFGVEALVVFPALIVFLFSAGLLAGLLFARNSWRPLALVALVPLTPIHLLWAIEMCSMESNNSNWKFYVIPACISASTTVLATAAVLATWAQRRNDHKTL